MFYDLISNYRLQLALHPCAYGAQSRRAYGARPSIALANTGVLSASPQAQAVLANPPVTIYEA